MRCLLDRDRFVEWYRVLSIPLALTTLACNANGTNGTVQIASYALSGVSMSMRS